MLRACRPETSRQKCSPRRPASRPQIFSAHDSTLFGLLSAFDLSAPAAWPEYGATLKVELWARNDGGPFELRFLLNDEVLRVGEGKLQLVGLERVRPGDWQPRRTSFAAKDEV